MRLNKATSFTVPALNSYTTTHHLNQGVNYGKPKTGSAGLPGNTWVKLLKWLKKEGMHIFRDADSGVTYIKTNQCARQAISILVAYGDGASDFSTFCKLDGIGKKVGENLA